MIYPNLISTTIPKGDLKEITDALKFIDDKLSQLVTLSSEELSSLPTRKRETIQFVQENLDLARKNPELVPDDVELAEIQKDVDLVKSIDAILEYFNKIRKKLEHSAILANSEAYYPSMAIYNSIKSDAIRKKQQRKAVKL